MDKIIFSGNVGKDTEYTEKDGQTISKFTVAVKHRRKGETETEWRNVTVFGKSAPFCRDYVKKGRTVLVEGRPSPRAYKNKLEEIVGTIDVVADNVELVGSANRDENTQSGQSSQAPGGFVKVDEEGLPF